MHNGDMATINVAGFCKLQLTSRERLVLFEATDLWKRLVLKSWVVFSDAGKRGPTQDRRAMLMISLFSKKYWWSVDRWCELELAARMIIMYTVQRMRSSMTYDQAGRNTMTTLVVSNVIICGFTYSACANLFDRHRLLAVLLFSLKFQKKKKSVLI